jgi:class 3 adenylate cyclase
VLDDLVETLRVSGVGAGLAPEALIQIGRELRPHRRDFIDNELLCVSGNIADRMWLLSSGSVVVREAFHGIPATVAQRAAPVLLGELALVRRKRQRTASVQALGHCVAYEIYYDSIDNISDPWMRVTFWRNLAGIAADKLAEAVITRARQSVDFTYAESILRRFANEYALGEARTGVREDYEKVTAVVWFSDLVGFSKFARDLAPNETAGLIKEATTRISDAIEAEGGHIDKIMGDGIMASWIVRGRSKGHKRAAADAAFRAAGCAKQGIAAISLGGRPGTLAVRIGLELCSAYAGDFGSARRSAF